MGADGINMPTFNYICEVCGAEDRKYRKDKPPRFCSGDCRSIGMAGQVLKPVKYVITQKMHERIKQVYQTMTGGGEVNDLVDELVLPRWKISRYAVHQGWIAKQKKEPDWCVHELSILERSAHCCPETIQRRLKNKGFKRSVIGIVLKRKRMRFLQNLHGQSARNVAKCFGIDEHVIIRWIKLGALKARKRGTRRTPQQGGDHWFIKDLWIRQFVVNYISEIDIRKVDKYWLIDLLTHLQNS